MEQKLVGRAPRGTAMASFEEEVLPGHSARDFSDADLGVVVARLDRLVEDRRVRCQPGDRIPLDVTRELPRVEQLPRDVVEPQTLPLAVQPFRRLHLALLRRAEHAAAVPAATRENAGRDLTDTAMSGTFPHGPTSWNASVAPRSLRGRRPRVVGQLHARLTHSRS